MGCDIHILTERKYEDKWFNCDNWKYNYYFGKDEYEKQFDLKPVYTHRNYELFSVLANVRNGASMWETMAGIGDKAVSLPYISEPKGIPEDCCIHTKEYIDIWDCDGHSHSYFTIKELYNYWINMSLKTKRSGVLVGQVLEDFDEKGIIPREWCKGYLGSEKSGYRQWEVEYNPLDNFMKAIIKHFCDVMWIQSNTDDLKSDYIKEKIEQIGDDFRVVFFFDN